MSGGGIRAYNIYNVCVFQNNCVACRFDNRAKSFFRFAQIFEYFRVGEGVANRAFERLRFNFSFDQIISRARLGRFDVNFPVALSGQQN